MLLPEGELGEEGVIGIGLLGEAVALVGRNQMPCFTALGADRGDHLIGFRLGHARIIGAGDDKHRLCDLVDAGQRADLGQLGALHRIAFVAIFDAAQILPVGIGVLEEAHEIADRNRALGGGELILELHGGRIAHVSAIGAACQPDLACIDPLVRAHCINQRRHILDRILALERAIVEADEHLAIAGRAANIGVEQANAKLVEVVVVAREEACAALPFRPAMDAHQHRALARKLRRIRQVENAGHFQPIEAPGGEDFRLDIDRNIKTAGLALRPAGEQHRGGIQRPDVRCALGRA